MGPSLRAAYQLRISASRRSAVHSLTMRATTTGKRPSMTVRNADARSESLIPHMKMRRIVVVKELTNRNAEEIGNRWHLTLDSRLVVTPRMGFAKGSTQGYRPLTVSLHAQEEKIPDRIAVECGCLDGSQNPRSLCYHAVMPKTLAYTLTIELHPDEGGYLAFFPALPGCDTWGAAYEEAVRNAEEVLIGYLEALRQNGEAIPEQNHAAGQVALGVRRLMEVAA